MKLSIIVPVYNVEQYLDTCVRSIVDQITDAVEVLLVDDGSTDNSGRMCDSYVKHNKCVRVIHKENGGLSSARNCGIQQAQGEYIAFVDSDDWIEQNCICEMVECLTKNEPEILITKLCEIYGEKQAIQDQQMEIFLDGKNKKMDYIEWILSYSDSTWPAVKYIVKREFIIKNNIWFMLGRIHEDIDWTSKLCYFANNFSYYPRCWYFHRMNREGAITNVVTAKGIIDTIEIASVHLKLQNISAKNLWEKVINRMMISVYAAIKTSKYCSKEDFALVCECVESHIEILEYTPSLKYKLYAYACKILGVTKATELLKLL